MAQQTINVGASPNDGTGTPLRTAFQYTNSNFSELYTAVGPSGNNIVVPGTATITGDLTCSSNVNIGASPVFYGGKIATNGSVAISGGNYLKLWNSTGTGVAGINAGAADTLTFSLTNAFTTAMTLNSTGLGVGVSPAFKLSAAGVSQFYAESDGIYASGNLSPDLYTIGVNYYNAGGTEGVKVAARPSWKIEHKNSSDALAYLDIGFRAASAAASAFTSRFKIDGSGNCGIGVTPSAWGSNFKVVQVGQAGSVYGSAPTGFYGSKFNLYNDNTNDISITNNFVGEYRFNILNGSHIWFNKSTSSGGVGVAQTLTQAMTLSATGQLLLGTSSTNGAVDIGMVMNKPSATGFVGNVYQLNSVDKAFAYIASAASAYTTETVSGYIIRTVSATNGVYLPNGGTSWLALSDERFKDIIEPISNAVAKVGSLRSVIGKFKSEAEGTRRSFLIAQDVQAVLPEAVDATKPDQLGVSYSDVIPLLVAAIKELTARVQTLEAK